MFLLLWTEGNCRLILEKPEVLLHRGDLQKELVIRESVAVDTETMGLNPYRDRLCLVQLSTGDGICHLIHLNKSKGYYDCPALIRILSDHSILKIFHYARFDVAVLKWFLGIQVSPIYCTKIASKLSRTFCDRHGLHDLVRELLGLDISKSCQSSDWGKESLSSDQQLYAAFDVFYLHRLKEVLDKLLKREGRTELAKGCFDFIPTCVEIDLLGYSSLSVLEH